MFNLQKRVYLTILRFFFSCNLILSDKLQSAKIKISHHEHEKLFQLVIATLFDQSDKTCRISFSVVKLIVLDPNQFRYLIIIRLEINLSNGWLS